LPCQHRCKSSGTQGAPAVAHVSNDFLHQMKFPGAVTCKLTVVRVGRTSLEHAVELRDANNPDVICGRGKIIHVWMDLEVGKSAPWPEGVLAMCWSE
jgi:acyl-CoA thioester hydrolase